MSYDLYFWRQSADVTLAPGDVLRALLNGSTPAGIARIPIEDVLARLRVEFPDIIENHTQDPEQPLQLIWDSPSNGTFLLAWSSYYLGVEGHGVPGDVFNRIIDVMHEFGCPLYDPQTETRYVGEG